MTKRTYTITTGAYDSYRVVARVQGPAHPALSTLYQEFCDRFGANPQLRSQNASELYARIQSFGAAIERAHEAGHGCRGSWAEAFIDWLVSVKEFEVIKSDLFHVDG